MKIIKLLFIYYLPTNRNYCVICIICPNFEKIGKLWFVDFSFVMNQCQKMFNHFHNNFENEVPNRPKNTGPTNWWLPNANWSLPHRTFQPVHTFRWNSGIGLLWVLRCGANGLSCIDWHLEIIHSSQIVPNRPKNIVRKTGFRLRGPKSTIKFK